MQRTSVSLAASALSCRSRSGVAHAQTVQAGTVAGAKPAAPAPVAAPSRLDDILARHTLRVCTTGDYKPYSFLRADGQFEGIDIDLAERLAKSLGVKAEYVKTSWSNLMNDFVAKCDIAVGGVSTTLERQKRAFFTRAVYGRRQNADRSLRRCRQVPDRRADRSAERAHDRQSGRYERALREAVLSRTRS